MTVLARGRWSWRFFAFAVAGFCLVILLAANAHLVYVAVTSQPDCVPHQKGEGGAYQAAKSAC
ncbi:hypothetical protein [Taklimakanibacter albus]|uniref:Uncharacterized protein n=1 Tax=Taklimakanibacter albus TaxID=2800327 RepID=A0ACC5R889_9HYPH|nr:hypothetical protein [Aestuariivirga sp. YIM B02566]MBK1868876.1 hypothetical protein [Aestuariivirga sp. YIM B02566]